jgi:spore germination protein
MKILSGLTLLLVALVAGLVSTHYSAAVEGSGPLPLTKQVSVNLVFWDQARGFENIKNNIDLISEVNPFWYTLDDSGEVMGYQRADGQIYEDQAIIDYLRQHGVKIAPTIANTYRDNVWPRELVSNVLYDQSSRTRHIQSIVDLAVSKNYDGINLDYENLAGNDRQIFSTFVSELASALHQRGKFLNVAVYPKTSDLGTWYGPEGQDYKLLGQVADKVVIMVYNYHWGTSTAGPIAPAEWEKEVLTFAKTQIPAHKLTQSIPLFGYDWIDNSGQDKVWQEHVATAKSESASINWHREYQAPYFAYEKNGEDHEAWYENALSFRGHLLRGIAYGVGNINLWRIGGEDPALWNIIRHELVKPM